VRELSVAIYGVTAEITPLLAFLTPTLRAFGTIVE
jgi:hypothetical protein